MGGSSLCKNFPHVLLESHRFCRESECVNGEIVLIRNVLIMFVCNYSSNVCCFYVTVLRIETLVSYLIFMFFFPRVNGKTRSGCLFSLLVELISEQGT